MPRFPVGNLANINLAEKHGWNLGVTYLFQELDTPFGGNDELPNPEGRRNRQQTLLLQAEFGLTERLALSGTLPLRHAQGDGHIDLNTSGLGDTEVVLRYATNPLGLRNRASFNLLGGVGLPTGRSEGIELTMENIQFGVGDFTGIAGLELSYRINSAVSGFFRSQARLVLGSNSDGYRFGNSFDNAVGVSFLLGASDLRLFTQLSTLHLKQDHLDGAPVVSRGGRRVFGALGLRFGTVGARGGVVALVQRLVDVNVRGDQLVSPWNFVLGYDIRLPGHEHPPGQ